MFVSEVQISVKFLEELVDVVGYVFISSLMLRYVAEAFRQQVPLFFCEDMLRDFCYSFSFQFCGEFGPQMLFTKVV